MAHELVLDTHDTDPVLLDLRDGPRHLVVRHNGHDFEIQIWYSNMDGDCDSRGTYTLDGKEARALVRTLMS